MNTLSIIILLLFVVHIIRDFITCKNEYEDKILSELGFGEVIQLILIKMIAKYFSGNHLFYRWIITIAGIAVIVAWIIKLFIFAITSIWFWMIIAAIGIIAGVYFFYIKKTVINHPSGFGFSNLNEEPEDENNEDIL